MAKSWAADAERRAQPLTELETSRTQTESEQDLAGVGELAVRALGEDVRSRDVVQVTLECPLSNLQEGTQYMWRWSVPSDPKAEPQTDSERQADRLPADEVERRLAPVRQVFREAGLRDADPYGWDIRALGDDWLAEANATVTRSSGDVMLETTCLAGGPGNGYDDE
ncbi:hypothetical protein [Curtobacterium sp. MCPF17_052]|uniref:hypothetical protein n=1 Tax=Curtobacterium sp. MCPF17_052 TaxID=2175655 RepID=UPI0024DFF8F0|nr:hypothetical protein [Curtobacterium sp. MCPF17_052]WIB12300.1 hypothetical protein DEJ36_16565 [Curtobacterium sp. MCPF17_052]